MDDNVEGKSEVNLIDEINVLLINAQSKATDWHFYPKGPPTRDTHTRTTWIRRKAANEALSPEIVMNRGH